MGPRPWGSARGRVRRGWLGWGAVEFGYREIGARTSREGGAGGRVSWGWLTVGALGREEKGCSDGAEGLSAAVGWGSPLGAAGRTGRALGCRSRAGAGWGAGTQPELCSRPQGRARGGAGMVLPSKGPGQPLQRRWRALAERNQSVAAVGAWVESAPGQQSPAFVSAPRAPPAGARTLPWAGETPSGATAKGHLFHSLGADRSMAPKNNNLF